MADDLSEFRSFLDGLHAEAVRSSQRGTELTAAALRIIYAWRKAGDDLDKAFGHLLPKAESVPLDQDLPPNGHALPQGGRPRVYANGLEEALRREGK